MRNSYAEGASFGLATALSVDGAALAKDVASIAGKSEGDNAKLESIASALYAQWKANDNGEGIGVYFGSESNDNFYGLYDCNNRMNVRSEACRHAAVRESVYSLVMYENNAAKWPASAARRKFYLVTDYGAPVPKAGTTDEYEPCVGRSSRACAVRRAISYVDVRRADRSSPLTRAGTARRRRTTR